MKVLLFGASSVIHTRRYIHLLHLINQEVVLVDHGGVECASPGVRHLRYPRRFTRLRRLIGDRLVDRVNERQLKMIWCRERPAICHVQWFDERVSRCVRAGLRPLVATAWGSDLNLAVSLPAGDPQRKAVCEALAQVDLLIVDSDDMVDTAALLAGREVSSVNIAIGIDADKFCRDESSRVKWRNVLAIGPDAPVVISVRTIDEKYRQVEIVRAFKDLLSRFPDAVLVIRMYGDVCREYLGRVIAEADSLGIVNSIRWVGETTYEDLPGLLSIADVAVNYPRMDAFPVSFIECCSVEMPIVSNRLSPYSKSVLAEFITFCEGESVQELSGAISTAVEKKSVLRMRAQAARQRVVCQFHERACATKLLAAYNVVTARYCPQ
jgi:glycosyltransferase involved in cell wall biosynthesis